MKKVILPVVAALSVVSLTACGGNAKLVETDIVDITKDEFYQEMKKQQGEAILSQMVAEKVLEKTEKVTDKEIEDKVKTIRDYFQSEEEYLAYLTQNNIPDEEALKKQIKMDLLLTKAALKGNEMTDAKLEKFYKENPNSFTELEASHILVKDEALSKELKTRLDNGEDFAKLAKEYSEDTTSAENGGSLGTFSAGSMVAEFEEAAFAAELNKVTEPVKTEYGYHIIKVTKKTVKTFEESKSAAESQYVQKYAKPVEQVLEDTMKKVNLKVNDEDLKNIFKTTATEDAEPLNIETTTEEEK